MSDHSNSPSSPNSEDAFFIGVMVLKDGKWTPHSKFDDKAFGSALIKAEDIDKLPDFDGVKIMRVPAKTGAGELKEMWISPRIKARAEVQSTAQVRAGVKQTKEQLATARRQQHQS